MGKQEDFDVAIIGSGVSGLVCGCYLQKAGLKVAIFENREEAGGGRMAHEAMRPNYLVQSCVNGDVEPMMMYQLDLELDRYGYQDTHMFADWGWGYIYDDDNTCLVNNCWDPRKTVEKIRRISPKDADKIMDIATYMAGPYDDKTSRFLKFVELFFLEPWTWENWDILLNMMAPIMPFKDPYEVTDLNGFEMLDLMYDSEKFKVYCASIAMGGGVYPHHTGGAPSLMSTIFPLGMYYSHPKFGCHSVAHVFIRCFRALGGKLFNSCPVKKIIVSDGEAKGVVLDDDAAFPGKEITAKKVISNVNPRYMFTQLIDEEHVEKRVIQKLKTNWKYEGVLVTLTYAVKDRPHFAAEKYDPDIVHSLTGMIGPSSLSEVMRGWGERVGGRIPHNTPQTYICPHLDDPTQTSPDNYLVTAFLEVPYTVYGSGGPGMWDNKDFRKMIYEMHTDRWDAVAPGFKKSVLTHWMTTPVDHERINPNYARGCFFGGAVAQHHMFYANRADGIDGFAKGGIVTPIKNLYGCGSVGAAWSSGGNGYRAACHVAEELGIKKNQTWWTHRAFEYITKKYIEKTYIPLKTSSVLDR